MGKKADLLLKQLVERDAEIARLKGMLNGGVSCRLEFRIMVDSRPVSVTKMRVRTAIGSLEVETENGEVWMTNSLDVLEINIPFYPDIAERG